MKRTNNGWASLNHARHDVPGPRESVFERTCDDATT